ncbi:MAG: family 78 glycoside hydrolase catalytic domain [Planctomycetes bacterium]|nr:family 78 glycoside hydrolase catalytic domain [Planctomycetota bacterium]
MAKTRPSAEWIWIASECHGEDRYVRARRRFTLAAVPVEARLRVTAFSEYVLYVNGRYVGCGPAPSSPEAPLWDEYAAESLPLRRGANVIGVLAHNGHVGTPRQARMPGALWLEFQATYKNGRTVHVATDGRWKAAPADDFSRRAPRVHWTAGFTEVRDTRREPVGWADRHFNDRRWAKADVVDPRESEADPVPAPRVRPVPPPAERFVAPQRLVGSGRSHWEMGATAIPFEFAVPDPAHGEFYGATFVHAHRKQAVRVVFDCDESAALYVNNRAAARQGYREDFVHWLRFDEHDDYAGLHRGQGRRALPAEVTLGQGWNSLGVVIYDPGRCFGFALRLEDTKTGKMLPAEFSPELKGDDPIHWQIIVDQLCPCGKGALPEVFAPNARTFPDAAYQLAWEEQSRNRRAPRGASAMATEGRGSGPLCLKDSEYVTYDFGREVVGYVELDLAGPAGAILDVAWAEALEADGRLDPIAGGMRRADRIVLRGGRQTVRFVNRRALRYLLLVARPGEGRIDVHRLGVCALDRDGPADGDGPTLETSDRPLTTAVALADRTLRACRQHTLEGSPAREAEQSVPAAYLLSQAERVLLGACGLGEAALRAFAADQDDAGRFRSIAPGGTEHTVPDWNLLWVVWLAEHVAWTGRLDLAEELYPAAERVLEWTATWRNTYGLLENPAAEPPWWLFIDHSPMAKRGEVTAWQALWVRALRASADLASWLGREEEADHARAEADAAARLARERLFIARRGRFVDSRLLERIADRASAVTNAYAVYGGLADPAQAEAVLDGLAEDEKRGSADWGCRENPYAKYFAAEALFAHGRATAALAMLRAYFGRMKKAGLVTVPEVFPLPDADKPPPPGAQDGPYLGRTPWVLCHGAGTYVPAMLARWVLGVAPEGPGFEPMRLAPMPADLKTVGGRVWTPKGWVEVRVATRAGKRTVRASLPEGLAYRLDRRHLAEDDEVEVTGGQAVEA